jgi:hypothetical protein
MLCESKDMHHGHDGAFAFGSLAAMRFALMNECQLCGAHMRNRKDSFGPTAV